MGRQTNTARRRADATSARERAAAARAGSQRRERRRRLWLVVGSAVGVIAVIAAVVAVGVASGSKTSGSTARVPASSVLTGAVAAVSTTTLNTIGAGSATASTVPKSVSDAALTAGGKPEVLFVGAEFCPYCAAERWAIVQSLSRFGTFSGLSTIHSSSTDVFPNTATFTFHGASYTSATIAFTSRETETVTGATLEHPTSAENALWVKYAGNPSSFPFLDIGGKYVVTGPSYDVGVLKGLTAQQIADQLADPTSAVAKAVDGAANVITAAICKTTNNQPAAVCSAGGVVAAAKTLGS